MDSWHNLPHVSPADPSVDPGPTLSMHTDMDGVLSTMFSLLPSQSGDHTTLDENPSHPSQFAAATWQDNGIMGSEFDFSDLPPLMPAIDHSATTSSQPTFHNQLFPMDAATGLSASVPQAIDNTNFFNFPFVSREINLKDKRTMAVCLFGILYVLFRALMSI